MWRSTRALFGALLATACWCTDLPAAAAGFQPGLVRPAVSPAARSSASRLTARANAHASDAAGNPYVNPNVAAGARTTQNNASANADAAEIRTTGESARTP